MTVHKNTFHVLSAAFSVWAIASATGVFAAPRVFQCGRKTPVPTAAQLDPQVTSVFTGTTCVWVCAETMADAVNRCAPAGGGAVATTPLPVYGTDPRSCSSPASAPLARFSGCCRPDPYSDAGVLVNGTDASGVKIRSFTPCAAGVR
jgi:hypothetical protein